MTMTARMTARTTARMTARMMARTTASALVLAVILGAGGRGRADPGSAPADAALGHRHEIEVALAGTRLVMTDGSDAVWGLGLVVGYGHRARPWLRLEAQAQFDTYGAASFEATSGWALGGASLCYDLGARPGARLLFAGLRLGAGFTREGDADGGLPESHPALVVAPRAGILLRLTDRLGLHAYAEYQGAYVPTDTKYERGSRHLIRVPIGITATF